MASVLEPDPAEPLGCMCPPGPFSIPLPGARTSLRNGCWEESGKEPEAVMAEPSQQGRN